MINFYIFLAFASGIVLGRYTGNTAIVLSSLCLGIIVLFRWNSLWSFSSKTKDALARRFAESTLWEKLSAPRRAATFLFPRRNSDTVFVSFLVLYFVFLGSLWIAPQSTCRPQQSFSQDSLYRIKVISHPVPQYLKNTFWGQLQRIDERPCEMRVRVNDFSASLKTYRTTYIVRGALRKSPHQRSRFYTLWLKSGSYTRELPVSFLDRISQKIDSTLLRYFNMHLSSQASGFLSSVLLGHRERAGRDAWQALTQAGAAHLFAISGFHVGLITAIIFAGLKLLRVPLRARLVFSIIFVYFYAYLVGLRPSVVRAAIMYSLFAFGFMLKRSVDPFAVFGLAGFICLMFDPLWIFDVSFQLSFVAVLSLLVGFRTFYFHRLRRGLRAYLIGAVTATLCVGIATAPLTSFYFGKIYFAGIISNIILVPVFAFILAAAFVFMGLWWIPYWAELAAYTISVSVAFFLRLVRFIGSFKFSYLTYTMSLGEVIIYYVVLILFVFIWHFYTRIKLNAGSRFSQIFVKPRPDRGY